MSVFLIWLSVESFCFVFERLPTSGAYQWRYIAKQEAKVNLITINKLNQIQEMVFKLSPSWSAECQYIFRHIREHTVQIRRKTQERRLWSQTAWVPRPGSFSGSVTVELWTDHFSPCASVPHLQNEDNNISSEGDCKGQRD